LIQFPLATGWYGYGALSNTIFGVVTGIDIFSFLYFWYLKFFGKTIGTISLNKKFI
jgi:hypothetical protein